MENLPRQLYDVSLLNVVNNILHDSVSHNKQIKCPRFYYNRTKKIFRRKKDYEKSTFRSYGIYYGTGHGR